MTKSSVVKAAVSHGYRVLKEVGDGAKAKQKNKNKSSICKQFVRSSRLQVAGFMAAKAATSAASSVAPCLTSDLFQGQVPPQV